MEGLFEIIKIVCFIQVLLITLLVLSIVLYKLYTTYSNKYKIKFDIKTKGLFNKYIEKGAEIKPLDIKFFHRHLVRLLAIIKDFDVSHSENPDWKKTKDILYQSLLLPKARQGAAKRGWFKRYLATQVFQQIFQVQDTTIIQQLIADPVPLVALNAARIAASSASEPLIETLIKTFSVNRQLQNAIFIQMIEPTSAALQLIAKYLNHEKDIYRRVFCYQLLNDHPGVCPAEKHMRHDMNAANIDLQIAALTCYISTRPKNLNALFAEKIQDPHWEIRAKVAKLIGKVGGSALCHLLEKALRDKNWWVRINAAESLYQLGPKGIKILKGQKPEEDQFAYDAAAKVLSTAAMGHKS